MKSRFILIELEEPIEAGSDDDESTFLSVHGVEVSLEYDAYYSEGRSLYFYTFYEHEDALVQELINACGDES